VSLSSFVLVSSSRTRRLDTNLFLPVLFPLNNVTALPLPKSKLSFLVVTRKPNTFLADPGELRHSPQARSAGRVAACLREEESQDGTSKKIGNSND
jgi:hypothetical protein